MPKAYNPGRRTTPCRQDRGCHAIKRLAKWRVRIGQPYKATVRGQHVMRWAYIPGGPWCWTCARYLAEFYSREYGERTSVVEVK